MEKLMIDMDSVITCGGFLFLINQFLGTNYTTENLQEYYLQNLIPPEQQDTWWDYFFSHNMYDHCQMLPEAGSVIAELNEAYKICIGTAYIIKERPRESGIVLGQKHLYLLDNLPFLTPMNFSFTNDKSFINCDIRIDDRLNNLAGAKRKILFSAWHNQAITDNALVKVGVERANNWLEAKKLLLKR